MKLKVIRERKKKKNVLNDSKRKVKTRMKEILQNIMINFWKPRRVVLFCVSLHTAAQLNLLCTNAHWKLLKTGLNSSSFFLSLQRKAIVRVVCAVFNELSFILFRDEMLIILPTCVCFVMHARWS